MAYEDLAEMLDGWAKHPHAKVQVVGQSLGNRNLYRLEITDPESTHPRKPRWVHYFANQHPGEFNSMWRMVGMIQWLLGDEGAGQFKHKEENLDSGRALMQAIAGYYRGTKPAGP